ncbi:hypothetical protein [Wolbachia endosymbiont of Tribolium confusum]|uniref:hypothetical protein n=1 Tax=Wolbachia endosymbiont of Tribolium confusum TaxID=214474 RepID=UPI001CF4DABC|nr:hypothetical protein [Wolbachia endosymbiont of Tribolium confusum]MCA7010808.1 hypothetical protein [Wolbachia endosymbiont of Tribolium confusum]
MLNEVVQKELHQWLYRFPKNHAFKRAFIAPLIVSVIAAEALLRKTISKKHKVKRKSFFLVLQISSVQAFKQQPIEPLD